MALATKNRKKVQPKVAEGKTYGLQDASKLVKDVTFTKFDSSVDLAIRLGVDPAKSDQMVRGTVSLPHGTGKKVRVLVLCSADKEEEAKKAGADYVGLDEYVAKIEKGWTDVDVVVANPAVMAKIGKLGRVLGPRNLMPNPKSGTVTEDVGKVVTEIKKGKISFRTDKFGIIQASVGKTSFTPEHLYENARELLQTILRLKPTSAKGTYLKSIYMSSTMSPSISIDLKSVEEQS